MQRHDLSLIRRPAGLAMDKAARAPTAYIPRFRERMMTAADQPYRTVALLQQVVTRLDRQETLLTEIRDALRHRGEAEAPPGHTVRY